MEAARRATPDDLPRLVDLAREAIAELRSTRGGEVWAASEARQEPLDDGLAAALAEPDALVLVGTLDDVVVGYAVASLATLPDARRLARLSDLYVEPGAREIGIGEALMDKIVDWATKHECFGIDSLVLPGNRQSKNFFESFGLVARAIVVHRPLGPGAEPQ